LPNAVEIAPAALRALKHRRARRDRAALVAAIDGLAADARPPGSKRLTNTDGLHRLRVGDWRIVYAAIEAEARVVVLRIARRDKVYRGVGRLIPPPGTGA